MISDEATNALDAKTEAAVMHVLDELQKRGRAIIISHRRSSLRGCDKVVRLDKGKIVSIGSPQWSATCLLETVAPFLQPRHYRQGGAEKPSVQV